MSMETSSPAARKALATSIHISALDGIVHVNSIFTLAVFLGLAWNPRDPSNSLIDDPSCYPTGAGVAESMVAYHVYSFGCFLFSSLVALGLKQAIRISDHYESYRAYVHKSGLRLGMLASAVGSVLGCGFLMMALVNVVQIKLGTLSCGSSHSFGAIVPLVSLVPLGLLIYVCFVFYAFTRSHGARSGGECGRTSPEMEAFKLAPCAEAAQDENAPVSATCCARIKQIGQSPRCLCAVMLSDTAKSTGAKPEIAVAIPKRCDLTDRPVGYKCGAYTLP